MTESESRHGLILLAVGVRHPVARCRDDGNKARRRCTGPTWREGHLARVEQVKDVSKPTEVNAEEKGVTPETDAQAGLR